jgi:hypothetical protein
MDLTRLYNLTTPELREEAERLGVSDTYAMSRGQLIHAIRNQGDGPPAEGLLGKVLGFAKWALKAAQEEPVEAVSAPVSEPVSEPVSVSASEPAPVSEPVEASEPASVSVSAPVEATESAIATEPESASGPPSRPPAGVFSKSAGRFEEPFPTRTMARILAQQGHFKRSLAIYGALLRDEPGNRDLSAEAEEVRTQSRARRSLVH